MKRTEIKSLRDARESIEDAIEANGQFSHNICSCVLRVVSLSYGQKVANDLIDEFSLTEIYGIHKVL